MENKQQRTLRMSVGINTKNDFFQKGTFAEVVDEKKLFALVRSKNACRKDTRWWDQMNLNWKQLIKADKPTELQFLEDLLKKIKNNDNEYFLQTSYFSNSQFGRVYPEGCVSMGQMRRPIRHFLCKDLYWDIDIINAHPHILLNLCEAWEYPCDELEKYVKGRDLYIKTMMKKTKMTRDSCKQTFISIMNGGSIRASLKEGNCKKGKDGKFSCPSFVKSFETEMKIVQKLIRGKVDSELYDNLTEGKTFNKI